MSAVIQCDWCQTVTPPDRAQAYWISVAWHTAESAQQSPWSAFMTGREAARPEQRTFCSVACLGMWAQAGEAVEGVVT